MCKSTVKDVIYEDEGTQKSNGSTGYNFLKSLTFGLVAYLDVEDCRISFL